MAQSDIQRLRAEAKRARSNANAKVARLRKQGIVVTGTSNDVRRAPGVENNYNAKQLRAYISKLEVFNSRSTQFVAGSAGRAITKLAFSQLEAAIRMSNLRAERRMARVAGVKMPGSDETYLDARKITKQRQSVVPGSTYDTLSVKPGQIVSEEAARELTRRINSKSSPRGRRRMNAQGSRNVHAMLNESSSPFLAHEWDKLSPEQQELLMNTPQFWEAAKFLKYEEIQNGEADENAGEISDFLSFARRTLPEQS